MPIMNKSLQHFVFFSCLLFFSCDFSKQINSTGKSIEVILVRGESCSEFAFDIFKQNFIVPQKPLLETEIYGEKKNIFHVIPILEKDFNSIFRTHKNIVFVNFADQFTIKSKKDLWAKNQNVYQCSIDENQKKNYGKIISFAENVGKKIKKNEITKRATNYSKITPKNIQNYLRKNYNLSVSVPSRFFIIDSLNTNLNLRGDTKKSSQRMLVSSFNLEPTIDNIILEQNRMARNYISSDIQGAYAVIEERASLYIDTLIQNKQEKINIKGLWKMEGDFMGGGFFTTLIINPVNKKKTLVSLYLYAPGENKANYILDLEAILSSVSYISN